MDRPSSSLSSRSYWLDKLDGAPSIFEVPADRPRPSVLAPDLHMSSVTLDEASTAAAQAFAQEAGADLGTLFLAAWQGLLAWYAERHDLLMGCLARSDRRAQETEWLILRSEVDPGTSFREIVQRTETALREASAVPVTIPDLLAELGTAPNPNRHPIFQIAFGAAPSSDKLFIGVTDAPSPPPDLILTWRPSGRRTDVRIDYAPALFDRTRIDRLAARFAVLIEKALAAPDTPLSNLNPLTANEHELLAGWNATAHDYDEPHTIAALVERQVALSPEAVAIEFGSESLTYQDLNERAKRLADDLVHRGVGPDVTVAISMERSIAMVSAVLAVLKAGGAYVPVDPAYPAARRSYMLEQSRARLLLTAGSGANDSIEISEIGTDPAANPGDPPTGANLGYVIFTSGSTGQPKAVALPQQALANLIAWQLRRPDFSPGARTLQFASLSFDVSFQEIFTTFCSGGTLVLIPETVRRDPRALLDYIDRHEINRLFLPFVALRGLADAALATSRSPRSLREVYTAGEQLVVDDTVRRFFASLPGCLLENQYGPSESHVVTAYRLEGEPSAWPALPPIGAPIANAQAHVLDAQGRPRPIGTPGELYLGGVCLAREYLGRPDLTSERFVERPLAAPGQRLYRTGDLARWQEDGSLEFLGRMDHQVKFRGFRIEPGEVASALSGYPGVRHCVASLVEVEGVGTRLAAYFIPREGSALDLRGLHEFARERLPDYMVPSHYVVLDSFPLTPSGKVDAKNLPIPSFDRSILSSEYEPPATANEQVLAAIWRRLLGVADVGRHDDFFELGGDSLMAVEMFLSIAEDLGRELPMGALAEFPTIAGLAKLLDEPASASAWKCLVPIRTTGDKTPLFCVHGGSGNIASLPLLGRALPADQPVYALQWDGLDGVGGARTIEAMAVRYVQDIRSVQPHGPYLLAGQCIGGLVAREIARILIESGEEVALLVMYDSPNISSRHYRLSKRLPPFPRVLVPALQRITGAGVRAHRLFATRRYSRRQFSRVLVSDLLKGQVAPEDKLWHSIWAMQRAVWRYTVKPLPVHTIFIHTGENEAQSMGLSGFWVDEHLGWSDHLSDEFAAHRVEADHNDVPFAPGAVALVTAALDEFHARSRPASSPAVSERPLAEVQEPA